MKIELNMIFDDTYCLGSSALLINELGVICTINYISKSRFNIRLHSDNKFEELNGEFNLVPSFLNDQGMVCGYVSPVLNKRIGVISSFVYYKGEVSYIEEEGVSKNINGLNEEKIVVVESVVDKKRGGYNYKSNILDLNNFISMREDGSFNGVILKCLNKSNISLGQRQDNFGLMLLFREDGGSIAIEEADFFDVICCSSRSFFVVKKTVDYNKESFFYISCNAPQDIIPLPSQFVPLSMNDNGIVCGFVEDTGGSNARKGCIFHEGRLIMVDDILDENSVYIKEVKYINNNDNAVGYGVRDGKRVAVSLMIYN